MPQGPLDSPRTGSLEIAPPEEAKLSSSFGMIILLGSDPQALRALKTIIILADQQLILAAAHNVHGFGHMLHDVEAVEDDFGGGLRNGFESGVGCRAPTYPSQLPGSLRVAPGCGTRSMQANSPFPGLPQRTRRSLGQHR